MSETNLKLSLLMYSSYFVLFARFFYSTYMQSRESSKLDKSQMREKDVNIFGSSKDIASYNSKTPERKTEMIQGSDNCRSVNDSNILNTSQAVDDHSAVKKADNCHNLNIRKEPQNPDCNINDEEHLNNVLYEDRENETVEITKK